jgi:hypothetical protein
MPPYVSPPSPLARIVKTVTGFLLRQGFEGQAGGMPLYKYAILVFHIFCNLLPLNCFLTFGNEKNAQ